MPPATVVPPGRRDVFCATCTDSRIVSHLLARGSYGFKKNTNARTMHGKVAVTRVRLCAVRGAASVLHDMGHLLEAIR
jgi:hypothetical protein